MSRIPYQLSDKAVARITKKLNQEFRHNRLALFDELNVTGVRKHIKKLYKKSRSIIQEEFISIFQILCQEVADEANALGYDGDIQDLDEGWVEDFFEEYSPVTKYVFSNEIDRKESYLFEAVVASPETKHQSYQKAEKYLINQIKQGGIEFDDAVAKAVYKELGVKKVRWIAEDDSKTCGVCRELDNKVFPLEKVPPKQHHNCRCYLLPIRDE